MKQHPLQLLRYNQKTFDLLYRACVEITHVFSIPTLLILLLKFAFVVGSAFALTYGLVNTNELFSTLNWIIAYLLIIDSVKLFIFLYAADIPANQASFPVTREANSSS